MANDTVHFLDFSQGESQAYWLDLSVTGQTPGGRYGHSLTYLKDTLILFGGNTGSKPLNDCWLLQPNQKITSWVKIAGLPGKSPSPRLYHSSSICQLGTAKGMMIIFGGRDQEDKSLNDTWGFRKDSKGKWDWAKAPYANNYQPAERYNVFI